MSSSKPPRNTFSADLMACLGKEDVTDLYLLGSDGVKVPAFRAVLACRSEVFRKVLCGDFGEAASDVVALSYPGKILKAVVEFCVTDDVRNFDGHGDEPARSMVQLLGCAHFFNIPLLQDKARALVTSLLEEDKTLACAVFNETLLLGEPEAKIKLNAINVIRKFPEDALLSTPGISLLNPEGLAEVVGDKDLACGEIVIFKALNKWATEENDGGSLQSHLKEDRVGIAKNLATSHIKFSSIRPTDLVNVVMKSCLVDKEVISEAFKEQALLAEKGLEDAPFFKKRKQNSGIRVSGAGSDVVNGFYEENGEHAGYPKYTKKCSWKGKERVMVIYKIAFKVVGACWYIAIIGQDGKIGASKNDFYYSSRDEDSVSADGWTTTRLGVDPCPDCQKL